MHIRTTLQPCKTERRTGTAARSRKRNPAPTAATFAASLSVGAFSTAAIAGPTGGVVVEGQGSISTPSAGTTVIDQSSHNLLLNWNTFNVGASESVQFNQPSSTAVALNRILDQNPSQIFGSLRANGQVVLVNPNGLLIGRTAQLNVNSLVVSSLDAIDFDASSGRYRFSASRDALGSVINEGSITAGAGGSVTLLGGHVSNSGSIVADFGTVNLAAGRTATLDLAGDGLLRLEVGNDLLSNSSGASSAVENSGTIQANGGQVLLTANAVRDVFTNLVNNTGVVRANRIDDSGGVIRLVGPEGIVRSSGTLDASAGDATSTGGRVEMLGDKVGLFDHAVVDVSGSTDGGTALIGGDYQGKNPDILNAQQTHVSQNATINADAGTTGDGGRVIVWADDFTRFDGNVTARGGSESGNGGFAEVSGKQSLSFAGGANLGATQGARGTLLLDPNTIEIDTTNTLPANASDGQFTINETPNTATIGAGQIATLLSTGDVDVLLEAHVSITQDPGADITVGGANTHSLTMNSEGTIDLQGNITLGTGALTLGAGTDITFEGAVTTNGGAVQATTTGGVINMLNAASIDAGTGNVTLSASDDVHVSTITTSGAVDVSTGAGAAVGNILHLAGAGTISAGTLTLNADSIGGTALNTQIDTTVGSLVAHASNGSVNIHETNGLTLSNVTAAGTGTNNINVTSDNGNIVVGTVTASDGVTLTATNGLIDDDGLGTVISANSLSMTAALGIGQPGDEIDTTVDTLTANSPAGIVAIHETDGLALDTVTAGELRVTSDNGNIEVGAVTVPGSSLADLNALNGSIVDDGNAATRLQTAALNLQAAGAIGTTGAPVGTDVITLNAHADAGGVFIDELNGLTLANVTAAGAGNDVIVTSTTGSIATGVVSAPDTVSLTAMTGAITANVGNLVTANTLSLDGTAVGDNIQRLHTNVANLDADTHAGDLFVTEDNGLTLTNVSGANLFVTSTTGNITAATVAAIAGANLTATAGSILDDGVTGTRVQANTLTLSAGAAIGTGGAALGTNVATLQQASAANGGVHINELNGMLVTNVSAAGAGNDVDISSNTGDLVLQAISAPDLVTLTATAGSILDDANQGTVISGTTLDMTAGTAIGAAGNAIDTAVGSLSADAQNGSVFIDEQDSVALTNVSAAGGGSDVTIQSLAGNLTVGTVSAPDIVSLQAPAGSILDDGTAGTRISANTVQLTANTNIGAAGVALGTNVSAMTASNNSGGIFINEQNDATLSVLNALGGGNVDVSTTGGSLTAGNISGNDVTLTASGAILDDNSNASRITSNTATLSAGTSIGAAGANGQIDTTVGSLNAATTNGSIFVAEQDGLALTNVTAQGAGSDINVTSAAGDIVVGTVSAPDAVALVASTGAITDDASNATRIAANGLTLAGATGIGAPGVGNEIDTDVASLTASAGGSILVGELNGLALTNLVAAGVGSDITVTSAAGDITVGIVSATDAVALTAAAGSITDDGTDAAADATAISAADITLQANAAVGTVTDFANAGGASIDVLTNGPLRANVASNTGQINLNIVGGAPLLTAGAITLGGASGNAGTVLLQSTGDLNAAGLGAGAVHIGTGNTTRVGLVSGGVLTLAPGGGFTDAPPDQLLVHGATDVVSSDPLAPHEFFFDATALNFQSGSNTGTTLLHTNVGRLDATLGNGAQLNVSEANDVTLGAVSAGNVSIAANGAIADDDAATVISGSTVTLSGTAVGAENHEIDTQAQSLTAASSAGGVYVREADGLTLSANSVGGPVDVRTANGALTAGGVQGSGVTLAAGGANDLTINGAVNGSGGAVSLTAGGAVVGAPANQISGGALTVAGSSIGAGQALNTTVSSLDATATNGGIFVNETDALTLAANATADVNVQTGNGDLTANAVNGSAVTLIAGGDGKALTVSGPVNATAGDVVLLAGGTGGAIHLDGTVGASGNATIIAGNVGGFGAVTSNGGQVNAGTLTAQGASIGANGARLNTNVATLAATATAGDIWVQEANDVNLAATVAGQLDVLTSNGSINVSTATTANGANLVAQGAGSDLTVTGTGSIVTGAGGVQLTAGRALTLDGAVETSGDVALTSSGGAITLNSSVGGHHLAVTAGSAGSQTAIVAGAGNLVRGDDAVLTGSAIGANGAALNTQLASLDAHASNGGIFVAESDALSLNAAAQNGAVDVRTANGPLTVAAAAGDGVTLAAAGNGNGITVNGAVQGHAGDVSITASGDGGIVTLNSAVSTTGDVTIAAGSSANRGAIVAGANGSVGGNAVNLDGSSIGSASARVNTAATTLNANSTSGGIFLNETDGVALNANAVGGALDVQAGGPMNVDAATGDSIVLATTGDNAAVTVNAPLAATAGAITINTAGNNAGITTGAVSNVGGPINLATTGGNAGITAQGTLNAGTGAVTLSTAGVGSDIELNAASGGPINIAANGGGSDVTLNGNITTVGDVTISAGSAANRGAINIAPVARIAGANLTLAGSAIGSAANRLNTTVASLDATSSNGGIFVNETDGLTLTANATGGAVDVETANGALVTNDVTGAGVTLTAGGAGNQLTANGALNGGAGNVALTASGDGGAISLNGTITTTGDVALTAGTSASRGAIVAGAAGRVSGASLNAQGSSIGSSASALKTAVTTLTANASGGDAFVSEQDGLTLADVHASGNVGVTTTSGNITVQTVSAGNDATLTANAGNISDDGDDTTRLSGNDVTLSARSIGGPSTLTGTTLDSKPRLDLDATSLDATATAGGIFIDEANGLSSVRVHATGGGDGDIELLTATGDLNLLSVSATDTLLLAAGRDIMALPGLGTITARAAELRAGGADSSTGHIGSLTQPISLQLSAGNTLRMFVPQSVDPNDPARAPSTLPSAGVLSTLSLYNAPSLLSVQAGFGQFTGLSDSQFTSPAEALVRSIQNQTSGVQTVLGLDWASFDPNVSLFGTLDPSVCLPADQRDEEEGAPGC